MVALGLVTACSPQQGGRTSEERTAATGDQRTAQASDSETALGSATVSTARESTSGTAATSASPPAKPASKKPAPVTKKPGAEKATAPAEKPDTAEAAATPSTTPARADDWVTYDAATNTVTFKLEAGPFSFNGFTSGGATLTVPPKSTVVMNFVQNDGTPHSAEVASGEGPLPNSGGDPAIPRAYTNKVVEGLPQGAKDVIRFQAPESGSYRIVCGVPGHALSGMWLWLKIDPAAKAPTFGATKK
jgi:Sulfocyanin (SoxE) domain